MTVMRRQVSQTRAEFNPLQSRTLHSRTQTKQLTCRDNMFGRRELLCRWWVGDCQRWLICLSGKVGTSWNKKVECKYHRQFRREKPLGGYWYGIQEWQRQQRQRNDSKLLWLHASNSRKNELNIFRANPDKSWLTGIIVASEIAQWTRGIPRRRPTANNNRKAFESHSISG